MTVKNYNKYLELSKVFNETFGAKNKINNSIYTEAVKIKILDETKLSAMYITVINLQREDLWLELSKKQVEEAVQIINLHLKKASEEYKAATGEKIKFKIMDKTVKYDIEFLNYSVARTNRDAYFRVYCDIEID